MFFRAIPVAVGALLATGLLWPNVLAAQPSADAGLKVEGAIADYQVKPGDTLTHRMVVSLGAGAPSPMDIQVDARGLGQGLDGATLALEPGEDASPYSGRTLITDIDHTSFRLDPGGSKELLASIGVPPSLTANRYADIYIHALPVKTESLDIILAAHVPVLLHPTEADNAETAAITDVAVDPVISGHPIVVTTTVKNTGNHHFKTKTRTRLLDSGGRQIAATDIPFSGSSILPSFSRKFTAAFGFLNRVEGLPAGTYIAETSESLPDGTILDTRRTNFKLNVDYRPFADIDPADLVVINYHDEVPYPIDARRQTDMELSFSNVGKVTGTVVLGRFRSEPSGSVPFAARPLDGGTGKDGLKFVGVGIQGFSSGVGHLSLYYRDSEVVRYSPSSLVLGFRVDDLWDRAPGFSALPGSQVVKSDFPVSTFNQNPIIGLGGDPVETRPVQTGISLQTALLIAGGVGGAAIVGTAGFMALNGRKFVESDPDRDEQDASDTTEDSTTK